MTAQESRDHNGKTAEVVQIAPASASPPPEFAAPGAKANDYTDGRRPGEWESKYPADARRCINQEAFVLAALLVFLTLISGALLALSNRSLHIPLAWLSFAAGENVPPPAMDIDVRLLSTYFVGGLGGTTFSIKWLVHSAAKCKWHLDRRYWRLFVPLIGGVYACVVLTLLDGGIIGAQSSGQPRSLALTAAFAFLIGYFSDGVSGLLSNVANAVFGTLEKK